jgi:CBS domain-containing protein
MGPAVQVRPDMTLQEVARLMLERDVDSVVVVDTDGAARGVITDHDLTLSQSNLRLAAVKVPRVNGHWVTSCDAIDAACVAATTVTAEEIMDRRVTTANVLESIGTVVGRMAHQEAEYSLVLEAGGVVGLLGRRDLLRLVAGHVEAPSATAAGSSTVHYPKAHFALRRGGLPLWGWLAQVQIRRKSLVDARPD